MAGNQKEVGNKDLGVLQSGVVNGEEVDLNYLAVYDGIAEKFRDYSREAGVINGLIQAHFGQRTGLKITDIGCGTGTHLLYLGKVYGYKVEGVDIDPEMLRRAQRKNPDVEFKLGDMKKFEPVDTDVSTSLYGSIGYAITVEELEKVVANMAKVKNGGLVLIEPWLSADKVKDGETMENENVLKDGTRVKLQHIKRIEVGERGNKILILDMKGEIMCTNGKVGNFTEVKRLGLFTFAEYREAMEKAWLEVIWDEEGLTGRGMFIGKKKDAD